MRKVEYEKSIAYLYPELAKQWHPTKNGVWGPEQYLPGSNKKIWWIGNCGHEWIAMLNDRCSNNSGCPYCSGRKALEGFNDLQTLRPNLAKEWHQTKNGYLTPTMVTLGSQKVVWWKCPLGHNYEAIIRNRVNKDNGCPYCSGHRVLKGFNDLETTNPELCSEWDGDANNGLRPDVFSKGSREKVYWKCKNGHSWNAAIRDRSVGIGCPYCSGNKVWFGFNDLETQYPEIAKEWHPSKNNGLTPSKVTSGSGIKVWWLGKCSHEWEMIISARTSSGQGCPYCAGKKVLLGFNDLESQYPEIVKEWHPSKNNGLTPSKVTSGSGVKVWWKCIKGHEWKTTIDSRTKLGTGCPYCSNQTSFPEQAIYYYSKLAFEDAENRSKINVNGVNYEADIYIPKLKTVIEYDGKRWHKDKNNVEKRKDNALVSAGYKVVRVKESENNLIDNNVIYYEWDYRYAKSFDWALQELFRLLGVKTINVDVQRDRMVISEQYKNSLRLNSLLFKYPEIAKEWHPRKNGLLSPDMFSYGSKDNVWWLGKCGHEWDAPINSRTNSSSKQGCPYCSGRRVLKGFNDFATIHRELMQYWDFVKNISVSPYEISQASFHRVWWKCRLGHSFQALITDFITGKVGCPYCSNRRVLLGYNDLKSQCPNLVKEWNYSKNGDLSPDSIVVGSALKVWWTCSKGHTWKATVASRSKGGNGCPYCSNKKLLEGFNDLASTYPIVAAEWNYSRNKGLTPSKVMAGSSIKIWWIHSCGHEWQAAVRQRCYEKTGCPICSKVAANKRKCVLYVDGKEYVSFNSQADCGTFVFGVAKKMTHYLNTEHKVRKGKFANHRIMIKNQ